MRFVAGATFMALGFGMWSVSQRLSSDALAMLVGIIVVGGFFVFGGVASLVLYLSHKKHEAERRMQRRGERQSLPAHYQTPPPVIIVAGYPSRQLEADDRYPQQFEEKGSFRLLNG